MGKRKFDAIIIGAGQAGPALAVRLAQSGQKIAIIERKYFGGSCVNTGCIPTKTLIASAHVAHQVKHADEFGIVIDGDVKIDFNKVMARKNKIVEGSREGVKNWLETTDNCTVIEGHARFENAHTIIVNEQQLEADKIYINVGARASVPAFDGLDKIDYLTNSSILNLKSLPEHLIIIGGSYIGLEFAQAFRRFGANVTIIEKGPRLIAREDEDISAAIKIILEKEGINICLNAECIGFQDDNNQIIVNTNCQNKSEQLTGSHVLLAVGRQANTDALDLAKAGVDTDSRGIIEVDDQLKTNIAHIFALGECNGKGAFTHTAYNDYEIIAANLGLLENKNTAVSQRLMAYNLYIDPPLGRAGMSLAEAKKSKRKVLLATRPMSRVKRAVIKGEDQGLMKMLVDADSKEILGASILGVGADEIIHSIVDLMYAKAPYTTLLHAVHIHPTVSELIPTMLEDLQ